MPAPASASRLVCEIIAGRLLRRSPALVESIVPWGPRAGAWRHTHEAGWQPFEPRIDLAKLETTASISRDPSIVRAARFLLQSWPEDVRRAAACFPEDSWLLLMHANYCGQPFVELLLSHPPLALLVAHRQRFQPLDCELAAWDGARALLSLRRRDIAARLGFPGSQRTVRVLSRVRPDALVLNTLRALRPVLADEPRARRLCFLPSLNSPVVSVLSHPAHTLLTHSCLLEIAALDTMPALDGFLARLERIARLPNPPAPFTHIDAVENYPRRLTPVPRPEAPRDFPPPPVPGSESITPIVSSAELSAEGEAMHHCCAGYSERVHQRDAYFYRMTSPMRLTICLHPTARGWALEESRGRFNHLPTRQALNAINAWLESHQQVPVSREQRRFVQPPPPRPRRPRRRRVNPNQLTLDFDAAVVI